MTTALVTGASGFIAKHVVLQLLQAGHDVVGTVRTPDRAQEVRDAVAPHLEPDALGRLRFVTLDLSQDGGWDTAMDGVDVLVHTASPFPLVQPTDPDDVIRPAVDGTLRALRAAKAAGIGRIVLTSSAAAILGADTPPGRELHDETDWIDPDAPGHTPYTRSKALAERAAWQFVSDTAPDLRLTTINPTLVVGPPLDARFGTSVSVIRRLLSGKDPMLPRWGLPLVDVRDIARMHVVAVEDPESTAGGRFIGTSGFLWMAQMAQALKDAYPDRKIATREAPDWLMRGLALVDKEIRTILPDLGVRRDASNTRARKLMGVRFLSPREAVRATAEALIAKGLV